MSSFPAIDIHPDKLAAVQAIAAAQNTNLDSILDEVLALGIDGFRQKIEWQERIRKAGHVTVKQAIESLRAISGNEPPMPGDEIPEELKTWAEELHNRC